MAWALGNMTTPHLRRLKEEGKNVLQLNAELRTEKFHFEFLAERLQKDYDNLLGGHKRWREEAVMLNRVLKVLEDFINKEMKMTAKDTRLAKLARRIAKASNESSSAIRADSGRGAERERWKTLRL